MRYLSIFLGALILNGVSLPSAEAATQGHSCYVKQIRVYSDSRVHVECTIAMRGVRFYAFAITDPAAALFQATAHMAYSREGGYLVVSYDTEDTSASRFGCASSDCRRPKSFYFGEPN